MKKLIKCSTCDEVIGELDKPEIADEDVAQYKAMVTCSNGHTGEDISLQEE
jgi:hypothetical protein